MHEILKFNDESLKAYKIFVINDDSTKNHKQSLNRTDLIFELLHPPTNLKSKKTHKIHQILKMRGSYIDSC